MRHSPALAGPGFPDWEAVDAAISDGAEAAFEFLERLVASPSTVGRELPAQQIVAAELDRLGFEVSELSVPPETAAQAPAGVAQADYAGRPDVLGLLNPGSTPSLLLNGHVDVVPAESGRWASDPFTPVRAGGWLTGRGAGDMKGGFAMGLLAVAALRRAAPGALGGELGFVSVIEEECTGNGTLAACRAGVLADAAVLLEPTDLGLLLGGTGILWAEIEIAGVAAHAESADRAVNPVRCVPAILRALAGLEDELNKPGDDPAFDRLPRPYNVNVGTVTAGGLALQRASPGAARGPGRVPPALDARRGLRPGAIGGARRGRGRPLAGQPSAGGAPGRVPGRGLPDRRRPPAGDRAGRGARVRARGTAPADGPGQHHRRAVLPQPVRRARGRLRSPVPQHPRDRRGRGTGQHRVRRPDDGAVHRRVLHFSGVPRRAGGPQ